MGLSKYSVVGKDHLFACAARAQKVKGQVECLSRAASCDFFAESLFTKK